MTLILLLLLLKPEVCSHNVTVHDTFYVIHFYLSYLASDLCGKGLFDVW